MQTLTIKQAYKLFNAEALKRIPKNKTKGWQSIMQINCIMGLAGLAGFYISQEYELKKHISYLEQNNLLTIKNIINWQIPAFNA